MRVRLTRDRWLWTDEDLTIAKVVTSSAECTDYPDMSSAFRAIEFARGYLHAQYENAWIETVVSLDKRKNVES